MRAFESRYLALTLLLIASIAARAATNVVTSTTDSGAGSLRDAVYGATAGDTIVFSASLSGQVIVLTTGQIVLSNNVTIDGSGLANGMVLNGNGQSRIFLVTDAATVMLNSLTLTNGVGFDEHGNFGGAGVLNYGTLTVDRCIFKNNNANYATGGGGICSHGGLAVSNCTFTGNQADRGYGGGGIFNIGTLTVDNSTFTANFANFGAGMRNYTGTATVNNSTFTANQSVNVGAIHNYGDNFYDVTLTVNNCTIVGNQGGGIYSRKDVYYRVGTLNLTNSIVCSNSLLNVYASGIYLPANNLIDVNAMLAPLGSYGGPTQTMPPLPGSPAINGGNDAVTASFATDQRGPGFPRKSGAHVDIGAVEFLPNTNPPVLTASGRLANGAFQFGFAYQIGANVTVFATTNPAWPISAWSNLGAAAESPPDSGSFQFTDSQATNNPQRFYRVRSP